MADSSTAESSDAAPKATTAPLGETTTGDAATDGDLTLPEALLLLALGDEEGRVDVNNMAALPYGLAAATLLTLTARERIRHEDKVWVVVDDAPTGDESASTESEGNESEGNESEGSGSDGNESAGDHPLTLALNAMTSEETPRGTMHWLRALPKAGDPDLQHRLLQHLVDTHVLEEKEYHFLGLVPYKRYPTEDPNPERRVRERVRRVVLEDETPDDRTLALIALMDACGLTGEVFSAKEKKEATDRLDALTNKRRVARAVSKVDDETTDAILAATTAATASATRTL